MTGATSPTGLRRGEKFCPCGRVVRDPQRGFWSGLVNYGLIPLFTLALYVLAVLAGWRLAQTDPVLGAVVLNLPVISLLVTLMIQLTKGHRGGCLMLRSFGWWLWWPGGAVATVTFG